MNQPENWPERCKAYHAELLNSETPSAPQVSEPDARGLENTIFRVVLWNGVRVPIPDARFEKIALIPDSLSAIRSKDATVLFSRIDLTPHFVEHFGEIEEFAAYSERGRNLVKWIEDGLALRAIDIECRPESMIDDLIRIVHSLFTRVAVLADEQTRITSINGANPALVLGSNIETQEKSSRIQYIFQYPGATNIELLTVTYHLSSSPKLIPAMNALVSAIGNGGDGPDSGIDGIVQALLNQDHERASSMSESIGLEVQRGLDW